MEIRRRDGSTAPASDAQRRIWFLQRLDPESRVFNMPRIQRIRGPLDTGALREAFAGHVRRHEIARTTYQISGGEPVQVIHDPGEPECASGTGEAEALAFLEQAVSTPFDLEREWPTRQGLFRIAQGDHLLVSVAHHIASDLWSGVVTDHEVSVLYRGLKTGSEMPSPPPLQYADYAVWQAGEARPEAQQALAYWLDHLAGAEGVLELPADRRRPAVQTSNGAQLATGLGAELSHQARELARRLETTPFRVLLAVFEVLVYRHTGSADFVVGIPVAGRTRPEFKSIPGCFTRTLPFRARIEPLEPFAKLIRRLSAETRHALRYQELLPGELMARLGVERDLAHSPLFQVVFNYLNLPPRPPVLPDCEVTPRRATNNAAHTDLTVYLEDLGPEMIARFEYNTDLFDPGRMERMAEHFRELLAGGIANPDTPVARIRMLGASESGRMAERRPTPVPPVRKTVPAWFAETAARRADAVAVRFEGRAVSYRELVAMAAGVRAWLDTKGVRPGHRVLARMERSPEMIAALLGVLASGAAYVPLDPDLPETRARFIESDSGAAVSITDADWPTIASLGGRDLAAGPDPAEAAYLIYTSGSTGQPRGVAIPHGALVNVVESFRREPGFDENGILAAVTTISFDIAALEIFLPLCAGGTIALASREEVRDGAKLARMLESAGATVLQATPAGWRLLLEAGWKGSPGLSAWCGGEALRRDLADALLPRVRGLWNCYGPTETTIWSGLARVEPGTGDPPVGHPVANTVFSVRDANGEPVPDGVPGELWIGGKGLALGYHNAAEATARKFVEAEGERMFRTGDLVSWRTDGQLEYLGRLDLQVKLRGHRIELGEVEAVLSRHESVAQCVVELREERLIAYAVYLGEEPAKAVLAGHCAGALPGYMVPSAFVRVEALQLTPNGKVDRKALPAPVFQPETGPPRPVRNLVEHRLAEIWQRVLNTSAAPSDASFFDLGGDSLSAARLFAAIEAEFGVAIPMVNIFQHPTVEGLAALIEKRAEVRPWTSVIPVKPAGTRPPLFFAARLHALACRHLAGHLHPEQPVYGLEPPGIEGGEPLDTVEGLAAHYVEALRTVWREGPYLLCGHSYGGFIVYEMARQLTAAGHEVRRLIILDCSPYILPLQFEKIPPWRIRTRMARHHLRRGLYSFGALWDVSRRQYVTKLMARARHKIDQAARQLREEDEAFGEGTRRTGQAQLRAYQRYEPGPYAGDLDLIRAATEGPAFDEKAGWQDLVSGQIRVWQSPGTHLTMMREPHARLTAEAIQRIIER